jgi:hypothetical protein
MDLIYERTTVCERGLSLESLEHDCTSIQQGSRWPYSPVKGNRIFERASWIS